MLYLHCTYFKKKLPMRKRIPGKSYGWPFIVKDGQIQLLMYAGQVREALRVWKDAYFRATATHILCIKHDHEEWFVPLWRNFEYGVKNVKKGSPAFEYLEKKIKSQGCIKTNYGIIVPAFPGYLIDPEEDLGEDILWVKE